MMKERSYCESQLAQYIAAVRFSGGRLLPPEILALGLTQLSELISNYGLAEAHLLSTRDVALEEMLPHLGKIAFSGVISAEIIGTLKPLQPFELHQETEEA